MFSLELCGPSPGFVACSKAENACLSESIWINSSGALVLCVLFLKFIVPKPLFIRLITDKYRSGMKRG